MIPASRNATSSTAPRLRTAANGESAPANHGAVMFGRAEVFRKFNSMSPLAWWGLGVGGPP